MVSSFVTFPQYDSEKHSDVFNLASKYSWTYDSENGRKELKFDDNGVLKEPDDCYGQDWNVKIQVSRTIKIADASKLYGDNGIAYANATIGLCIIWTSVASGQRGVYTMGEILNSDDEQTLELNASIPPSSLREAVDFTLSLYISKEGSPENNNEKQSIRANKKGMIIGCLDTFQLLLDGMPDFPIMNFAGGKDAPLWQVRCDWEDINDSFLDTVAIYFNTSNDLFKYVDKTNQDKFDVQLLREILSSALLLIIAKYQESDPNFSQLDSAQAGSVADYVRMYINTWNVDTSSLNTISMNLRKKLEQKI